MKGSRFFSGRKGRLTPPLKGRSLKDKTFGVFYFAELMKWSATPFRAMFDHYFDVGASFSVEVGEGPVGKYDSQREALFNDLLYGFSLERFETYDAFYLRHDHAENRIADKTLLQA